MLWRGFVIFFGSNRTQCVKYQNTYSDWMEIKSGAPQGTRLGPIIFLAMINDACNSESIPCWKYVDDLTLLECRNINAESNIQQAVDHLHSWSEQNNMRLNPRKWFTMHVSFARNVPPLPDVMIGDTALNKVDAMKLLGVTIQHDLESLRHVVEMIKKANTRLHFLRVLKGFRMCLSDMIVIYSTFIRPVLEYCTVV